MYAPSSSSYIIVNTSFFLFSFSTTRGFKCPFTISHTNFAFFFSANVWWMYDFCFFVFYYDERVFCCMVCYMVENCYMVETLLIPTARFFFHKARQRLVKKNREGGGRRPSSGRPQWQHIMRETETLSRRQDFFSSHFIHFITVLPTYYQHPKSRCCFSAWRPELAGASGT